MLTVPSISVLRPILSPSAPQMIAPSGLAARPTPKVASDASKAELGSSFGKNSLGRMVAATAP